MQCSKKSWTLGPSAAVPGSKREMRERASEVPLTPFPCLPTCFEFISIFFITLCFFRVSGPLLGGGWGRCLGWKALGGFFLTSPSGWEPRGFSCWAGGLGTGTGADMTAAPPEDGDAAGALCTQGAACVFRVLFLEDTEREGQDRSRGGRKKPA